MDIGPLLSQFGVLAVLVIVAVWTIRNNQDVAKLNKEREVLQEKRNTSLDERDTRNAMFFQSMVQTNQQTVDQMRSMGDANKTIMEKFIQDLDARRDFDHKTNLTLDEIQFEITDPDQTRTRFVPIVEQIKINSNGVGDRIEMNLLPTLKEIANELAVIHNKVDGLIAKQESKDRESESLEVLTRLKSVETKIEALAASQVAPSPAVPTSPDPVVLSTVQSASDPIDGDNHKDSPTHLE